MSTIGGLSTSTSSNIRGYGGLASGLDRDTLIEGMTYGTTSKITQQKQKKTQLEWKQAAVRNISDMMIAFAGKYTETLTSPSNLFSSVFWGRNKIATNGENSKKVSVTGTASSADAITIMGVKQLAEKARLTSKDTVSSQELSGNLKIQDKYVPQDLIGKDITFEIAGKAYSVSLPGDAEYSDLNSIKEAINKELDKTYIDSDDKAKEKLSDYIKADVSSGKLQFKQAAADKEFSITGGTALEKLGFAPLEEGSKIEVNNGNPATAKEAFKPQTLNEKIGGKSLFVSYNGKMQELTMLSTEKLNEADSGSEDKWAMIKDSLQQQLDTAFGKNRVKVEVQKDAVGNAEKITFTTMKPDTVGTANEEKDPTSVLTVEGGNNDLKEVLGLTNGASNHLNLNAQLGSSGLAGMDKLTFTDVTEKNEDGTDVTRQRALIKINGKDIEIYKDDTVRSLMNRINEKTDVTISYQSTADKFTITSKENGGSGTIKIEAAGEETNDKENAKVFSNAFFGKETIDEKGKDAIVTIKYAGSDEEVDLIRDSNTFTVDGLTIAAKDTFGYKKVDGKWESDGTEPVSINAQVDVDNIMDNIKSMVEEYNKIVDLVNKELTTKPNRDYSPLTSEQKKELDDDEIKLWEEKAKEGLLFGDSDLRSLSSDLRFVISGGLAEEFRAIGISTSTLYSDNGKISIDETKLRAALETDPEKVERLFTSKAGIGADGKETFNGFATNLRNVMDKYVKTIGSMESKGILIRKAGSTSSPMSVTENTMYKQLSEIEKMIARLQERLETERDRYIKQFTSLETLISQMNSQSGYLSQMGGY